jgi:phospholipase A-2-activating protein
MPNLLRSYYFFVDGDFVTCGDDGFLRIFSLNISKTQSPAVEQLNAELALEVAEAKARRHNGPSAEEIAKAPLWEQRAAHPGKSADQVCVFNQNGSLVAAQWISGSWVIVGTVTSTGDGGYLNEVWYDHIMPVEIETPSGVMTLKLGHNNGENPFSAAQRFIDQNQLQQAYLSQIADWITARSGQTAPTIGGSAGAGPVSGASTAGKEGIRCFAQGCYGLLVFTGKIKV